MVLTNSNNSGDSVSSSFFNRVNNTQYTHWREIRFYKGKNRTQVIPEHHAFAIVYSLCIKATYYVLSFTLTCSSALTRSLFLDCLICLYLCSQGLNSSDAAYHIAFSLIDVSCYNSNFFLCVPVLTLNTMPSTLIPCMMCWLLW